MEEILKNITMEDFEKLKSLFSILSGQQPKEVVTLRVFREEYLNLVKSSKSISYYNSVRLSFDYLVEHFGVHSTICSINQKEIERFLIKLQEKVKTVSHSYNQSGNGYEVYYRNIKAAFNKAKEWNYIQENYFTKVKLPKRQRLSPVFINCDQLSAICEQIKNETVKDVVVLAFYTGMRLDEIVNLKWKNVDLSNKFITVGDENFITKGRKQRFIPIDEVLSTILLEIRTSNEKLNVTNINGKKEYVFCKRNGSKLTGNYFSKRFKKACAATGMDKAIHFHSLRHSFASNLVQRSVPLYTIKELLGHSSVTTTEIYSHLDMKTLRDAVEKLNPVNTYKITKQSTESTNGLRIFKISKSLNS